MILLRVEELGRQTQRCFKNALSSGRKGLSLQNPPLTDAEEITLTRKVWQTFKVKRKILREMKSFFSQVSSKDAHVELLLKELLVLEKDRCGTLMEWLETLLPESKKGAVLQGTSIQNAVSRELTLINTGLGSCSYYLGKILPGLSQEQQMKVLMLVEEFNKRG